MAQVLAGCSTRWHGCMSGAGAVTHFWEQSNPQASQSNPEPKCGHLSTQMVLLRAFLSLLRKELNGKSLLMSTFLAWFRLCHRSALYLQPSKGRVLLIALVLPYMNGVAVDCDAK